MKVDKAAEARKARRDWLRRMKVSPGIWVKVTAEASGSLSGREGRGLSRHSSSTDALCCVAVARTSATIGIKMTMTIKITMTITSTKSPHCQLVKWQVAKEHVGCFGVARSLYISPLLWSKSSC